MKILGIETSCDETAAAVIEDGEYIHSNVVASQAMLHAQYGGIVPELASRQHMITIVPVIRQALDEAGIRADELDGVAVTHEPGACGRAADWGERGEGVFACQRVAFYRAEPSGRAYLCGVAGGWGES